jgi:hypothetical protein
MAAPRLKGAGICSIIKPTLLGIIHGLPIDPSSLIFLGPSMRSMDEFRRRLGRYGWL